MKKYILIFSLPFFTWGCLNYKEPQPKYVNDGESVNGNLICIYSNTLFINKKDAIYKYDLNGNSISNFIFNTSNNFPIMENYDSIMIRNHNTNNLLININQSTPNNLVAATYLNYTIKDLVQFKNKILFLDSRQVEYPIGIYIDTLEYKYKYNINNISSIFKENIYAIEKVNDSLVLLLTQNIELFNINQPNKGVTKILELNGNLNRYSKMKFNNNQLIISSGNKIWFFTYNVISNTLTLNSELD